MKRAYGLIATAAAAIALAGCGSTGSTTAASAPSSAPSAAPSSAPVAAASSEPSAVASSGPCVTRACIVSDVKQSLVGEVAKDESVLTKMTCIKSTVRQPAPGVYTVHCTATYSDGTVYAGIASVLIAKGQVTWEVTG